MCIRFLTTQRDTTIHLRSNVNLTVTYTILIYISIYVCCQCVLGIEVLVHLRSSLTGCLRGILPFQLLFISSYYQFFILLLCMYLYYTPCGLAHYAQTRHYRCVCVYECIICVSIISQGISD